MNKDIHDELDAAGVDKVTYKGSIIHPFPGYPEELQCLFLDDYPDDSELLWVLRETLKQVKEKKKQ